MYDSSSNPKDESDLNDHSGAERDGAREWCRGEGNRCCIMAGLPLESMAPLCGAGAGDYRALINMRSLVVSNLSGVDGRSNSPIWPSRSGESNRLDSMDLPVRPESMVLVLPEQGLSVPAPKHSTGTFTLHCSPRGQTPPLCTLLLFVQHQRVRAVLGCCRAHLGYWRVAVLQVSRPRVLVGAAASLTEDGVLPTQVLGFRPNTVCAGWGRRANSIRSFNLKSLSFLVLGWTPIQILLTSLVLPPSTLSRSHEGLPWV